MCKTLLTCALAGQNTADSHKAYYGTFRRKAFAARFGAGHVGKSLSRGPAERALAVVGNGELDRVTDVVGADWNSRNTGAKGTRRMWSTFDIVLVIAVVVLLAVVISQRAQSRRGGPDTSGDLDLTAHHDHGHGHGNGHGHADGHDGGGHGGNGGHGGH